MALSANGGFGSALGDLVDTSGVGGRSRATVGGQARGGGNPLSVLSELLKRDNTKAAAPRPGRQADSTILSQALRARATDSGGSSRGSVLGRIYGIPGDTQRTARTLQAFNGPQGNRLVLGR